MKNIYVCVYIYKLNHFAVYQKLTQQCKSTVHKEKQNNLTKRLLVLKKNSCKLQDTKLIYKNLLHSHTLTTNYQKEKLRKLSDLQFH